MGFQELARSAAVTAFDIIGDLSEVTFNHRTADPVYDPNTGTLTENETAYSVEMLISRWHAREVDNLSILPTDMKAIIPYNKLPITPTVHCTVTHNGIELDIIDVFTDPMTAAWTLQLRKP